MYLMNKMTDTLADGKFQKLNRAPAYQAVSQKIRSAIINGELKAGELLPTEMDLAEQFGVTRTTIREAIRLLEYGGLIGRADRKRLVVCLPSKESASNSLSTAMLMHEVTFKELWQIAMGLEPLAAGLACESISTELKEKLATNLEQTAAAKSDTKELLEAEIEFHNLIAQATCNNALLMAREPLNQLFYPAFKAVIDRMHPGGRILDCHTRMYEAICQGDKKTAEEWMRKHMVDFERGIKMAGLDFNGPIDHQSL